MKTLKIILSLAVTLLAACSSNDGAKTVAHSQTALVSGPPPWTLTTTAADWDVVYDGYGSVTFDANTGIVMQPQNVGGSGNTQAALILAKITQPGECPLQNFSLTVTAATEQQFRTPTPNAWEVLWLFFNYNPVGSFKETNDFIFKPNGIELGRAFNEIDQEFMPIVPLSGLTMTIGQSTTYRLEKQGQRVQAWIDGTPVMDYTGVTAPKVLYDVPGAIGLYTEDARIRITSVVIDPYAPASNACLGIGGSGGASGSGGAGGSGGTSGSGGSSGVGGSSGASGSTTTGGSGGAGAGGSSGTSGSAGKAEVAGASGSGGVVGGDEGGTTSLGGSGGNGGTSGSAGSESAAPTGSSSETPSSDEGGCGLLPR